MVMAERAAEAASRVLRLLPKDRLRRWRLICPSSLRTLLRFRIPLWFYLRILWVLPHRFRRRIRCLASRPELRVRPPRGLEREAVSVTAMEWVRAMATETDQAEAAESVRET